MNQTGLDLIRDALAEKQNALATRDAMVHGDMWADGDGWIGPRVNSSNSEVMNLIEEQFVYSNLLAEVIERHVAAVLSESPFFKTSPGELADLLNDAEPSDTRPQGWYSKNAVQEVLQLAVGNVLWASVDDRLARAPLRVFTPATIMVPQGNGFIIPKQPFDKMIHNMAVSAPSPLTAGVIYDEDGYELVSYYQYEELQVNETISSTKLELSVVKRDITRAGLQDILKPSILPASNDDDTIFCILDVTYGQYDLVPDSVLAFPLGGFLFISELERKPLVKNAVISQQKLYNLANTMMSRNVVLGGFVEETFTNAQDFGYWTKDNVRLDEFEQGATWTPEAAPKGAGVSRMVLGQPKYNDAGNLIGYENVGYHVRQPVSPTTFIETMERAEWSIYKMCAQLHVVMADQAEASGLRHVRGQDDFKLSLGATIPSLKRVLEYAVATVVRLAAFYSSDGDKYKDAEVEVDLNPFRVEDLQEDALNQDVAPEPIDKIVDGSLRSNDGESNSVASSDTNA